MVPMQAHLQQQAHMRYFQQQLQYAAYMHSMVAQQQQQVQVHGMTAAAAGSGGGASGGGGGAVGGSAALARGVPPARYVCRKCRVPGHYVQDCTAGRRASGGVAGDHAIVSAACVRVWR